MLVSLKWLKDYININIPAEELAEKLTMAGLEVDEIKTQRPSFSKVVVAKILSVEPHPAADKLSLCSVTDGTQTYRVVCGAKNIKAGDIVPLAKIGATIPGGHTIKSSVLRGEKSNGMLCSEAELETGDNSSGIWQLPEHLTLGESLETALDLGDTVLDVSITPNRSDCLSMIGIAREAAVITGGKIKIPVGRVHETLEEISLHASVTIIDADLCPRYSARLIKNVKIGSSPAWIKKRLESAGIRSVNNVVDVTNFVMLEMGQPLHAFDFRYLEKGKIIVRKSTDNEEFTSLDGKARKLPADTLLICDGVKPVAIGGIMGGLNSEVKDDTQVVLLESAYFDPGSIRRSARKLAMPTDASFRFERGINPEGVILALNRAAQLIADISGGNICRNYIDEYPHKIPLVKDIPLRLSRVCQLTGAAIDAKDIVKILQNLGMIVGKAGRDSFLVTPPAFRTDIKREIDLIEEVVRIYGYDRIPLTLPIVAATETASNPRMDLENKIRHILTGSGYSEVVNYSFVAPESADQLCLPLNDERRRFVRIKNPLAEDQSVMRTTMVFGLLETMKKNNNNGSLDLKIFEMGCVFLNRKAEELPEEKNMLACLLTGTAADNLWGNKVKADFYDLKGCLENIFYDLKLANCVYRSSIPEPFLHPGKSCEIFIGEVSAGYLGQVHPDVLERMDLKNSAYILEINLDILTNQLNYAITYQEISKFPAVTRDVSFLIPVEMETGNLIDIVLRQNEELLENAGIFDIYAGKGIADGEKSLGLRFSYRAPDRTLTDVEVNNIHDRIVQNTIGLTGAKIRGE